MAQSKPAHQRIRTADFATATLVLAMLTGPAHGQFVEWSPTRSARASQERAVRTVSSIKLTGPSLEQLPTPNEPVLERAVGDDVYRRQDGSYVVPFSINGGNIDLQSHGGLISIVARDASLKEVLTAIARSQKLNLVYGGQQAGMGAFGAATGAGNNAGAQAPPSGTAIGPSMEPKVTVSLEKVPLDTALDTILSVVGFAWTRSQGIILVTPASQTAKLPPNAQGRTMHVFELDFATAEDINLAVQGLLSPVGQSFIHTSQSTDNRRSKEIVVVEDLPRYVDRIGAYIAQLDVPPRQVAIQAYVLQVDLNADNRHGVNLEHLARIADPRITIGSRGLANQNASQAFFLELDGNRMDGFLEALRTTVDAKTLASPRIIAVNGQTARLQVGEQLGFRITTTTQTSTLESVEFLDVGVVLEVTPRISRDGRVLLNVSPEVSSGLVNPETGLPQEETAELQTDVLLDDGQGIVVGGLIKEELTNSQTKVPGIGDVPYLGALFQRRSDKRGRSEIIVALVPRILPLHGEEDCQNMVEFERASTPLLKGALVENPRPMEPSLPDPLKYPKRGWDLQVNHESYLHGTHYGNQTPTNMNLRDTSARPTAAPSYGAQG
ncbi:MAG: hypothetical protein KDB27_17625, partial [Planctomycetales bacterium]|nr:hypothetical protein [Planctomycetales bacterium]